MKTFIKCQPVSVENNIPPLWCGKETWFSCIYRSDNLSNVSTELWLWRSDQKIDIPPEGALPHKSSGRITVLPVKEI